MDRVKFLVLISSLTLMVACLSGLARADQRPVSEMRRVSYSAKFATGAGIAKTWLRIRVGRNTNSANPKWVACISRVGQRSCESTCEANFMMGSLSIATFSCESASLKMPLAPLTLFRDGPRSQIRFGTWVDGYRDFALKVERDEIQPVIAQR